MHDEKTHFRTSPYFLKRLYCLRIAGDMKVLLPVRARHKLSQSFFKDFALEREILVRWLPNVGALASAGNFLLKSAFLPFSFPSGDDVCLPAHGD